MIEGVPPTPSLMPLGVFALLAMAKAPLRQCYLRLYLGGITDGVGGIADGEASLEDEAYASCFCLSLHFVNKMDKAISIASNALEASEMVMLQPLGPRPQDPKRLL